MDQRTLVRATLALLLAGGLTAGCTGSGRGGAVEGRPGAAGLRDPYFPKSGNGGYDVRHYALTLDYEPSTGRLRGTAEITARATQALSAFNLDLLGMDVQGATVDGEEAAVHRAGQELTLRPGGGDLEKGATFRTVVRYSGTPLTVTDPDGSKEGWLKTADGVLALGQPTGSMAWFPGNHHPSDKASYTVAITVPEGLQALSNGELTEQRTRNGRTTFAWSSSEPMASYLATLAIGRYDIRTSRTPSGLPVRTAVDTTVTRDADTSGRTDTSQDTDGTSQDTEEGATALIGRIPELLAWETENFGPYPFSSTGAIVDRKGDVAYALETQTMPVFPGDAFDTPTLVHELAHQWYGNSVTPETWRDMWLNEGFATYAEWLYGEDFEETPAQERFDTAFADKENWRFAPAEPPSAEEISDPLLYDRGAMVLHKVRQAVGDDAFHRVLQGWPATYRHSNASTEDFTRYVEAETGKDLTDLWDTWLYGTDRPSRP
ncbi:M1 family metallopeptidase [Streptomyces sp. SP18CS02]|uniref:M1 family metallopeptidase n=1 Tax=Streptomyces sp. SP18CS02 TaxID=3002531 RepID=UPI002E7A8869|nr:M1 family metallopeptidase [Streptomyces sp. SP18CS02]MEE1755640.1 M1 family metallopeptidase [Streptomyces sp. SP18CS02]